MRRRSRGAGWRLVAAVGWGCRHFYKLVRLVGLVWHAGMQLPASSRLAVACCSAKCLAIAFCIGWMPREVSVFPCKPACRRWRWRRGWMLWLTATLTSQWPSASPGSM